MTRIKHNLQKTESNLYACYYTYVIDKCKVEELKKRAAEMDCSIETIKHWAREYAIDYLHIPPVIYDEMIIIINKANSKNLFNKNNIINFCKNYDEFSRISSTEELNKFCIKYEFDFVNLYENKEIYAFFLLKDLELGDEINCYEFINKFKAKVERFKKYYDIQKCKIKLVKCKEKIKRDKFNYIKSDIGNEEYKKREDLIKEFISSTIQTEAEYCESKNITIEFFNKILNSVKKYNNPLYKQYIHKTCYNDYKTRIEEINTVIDGLKNDIALANGQTRKFDILDYYLTTGISLEKMVYIADNFLSREDDFVIRKFVGSYNSKELTDEEKKELLSINMEKNNKRDANGYPIPGTGIVVTKEDKEMVFKYLEENDIPITHKTFQFAVTHQVLDELPENVRKIK